jgi:predicted Zn-dependent protease
VSGAEQAKKTFERFSARVRELAHDGEDHTLWFEGEDSTFVRFNHGRVRQPGDVKQRAATIDLARGKKHAAGTMSVSGDTELDDARLGSLIEDLRAQLDVVPEDPYLLRPDDVRSSERVGKGRAPDPGQAVSDVLDAVDGLDFVGIFASGPQFAGFADSRGQTNWFENQSFNLDFSVYDRTDKAVKGAYAGLSWSVDELGERVREARDQLDVLRRDAHTAEPGEYRVYLTPAAVSEMLETLAWGGFGKKARETKRTPLIRMLEHDERFSEKFTLVENTDEGIGPTFSREGFVKPGRVDLIKEGRIADPLVSARSAQEYSVPATGANSGEQPKSLDLAPGALARADVLRELDHGVLVSNLWYLNYSDRENCRLTGMTRFATFWVEGGEIVAPMNVMRFDETLYRAFGTNLRGLTRERDFLPTASTYEARETFSTRVPGALIDDFRFTL